MNLELNANITRNNPCEFYNVRFHISIQGLMLHAPSFHEPFRLNVDIIEDALKGSQYEP